MLAVLVLAAPLVSVLWGVIGRAVPVWHWSVLTQGLSGTGGGLVDLIVGTLVLVAGVGIVAGLVGVASGSTWQSTRAGGWARYFGAVRRCWQASRR